MPESWSFLHSFGFKVSCKYHLLQLFVRDILIWATTYLKITLVRTVDAKLNCLNQLGKKKLGEMALDGLGFKTKRKTKLLIFVAKVCCKVTPGIEWSSSVKRVSSSKPAGQSCSFTFRQHLQQNHPSSPDDIAHRHVLPAAPHFSLRYLLVHRHHSFNTVNELAFIFGC